MGLIPIAVQIVGVRQETVDGRPQLVLDIKDKNGRAFSFELTREVARELTRAYGHHPLVDEFFRTGKGVQ